MAKRGDYKGASRYGKVAPAMNILSIQSHVAYGHVGNSTAIPVLQRLGHEAWPVHTTLLSNHLGYPTHTGRVLPPEEVAEVVEGLAKLGLFGRFDALLTGFLGHAATVAADAARRLKSARPEAIYCLDPVMGERAGGLYVAPATVEAIGGLLLPLADFVLPNAFELDLLAGGRTRNLGEVIAAAQAVARRARPGAVVVATGLDHDAAPGERIEVLAAGREEVLLASVPRLELPVHGAGDLFAATFLAHYLERRDLPAALAATMDSTHEVFLASVGHEEMALVAALDRLAHPPKVARIERLS
jgi:pyridoxine kinase